MTIRTINHRQASRPGTLANRPKHATAIITR